MLPTSREIAVLCRSGRLVPMLQFYPKRQKGEEVAPLSIYDVTAERLPGKARLVLRKYAT